MRFESVPVTADGTQIPYEFTDSRVESTDAEVVCLVGNGRDVSPRVDGADEDGAVEG